MEIPNHQLKAIFKKLKIEERRGGPHVRGWIVVDGRPLVPLKYSYSKSLNGWAAENFIKELFLSKREFARLVTCTLSRDDVIRLVQERFKDEDD